MRAAERYPLRRRCRPSVCGHRESSSWSTAGSPGFRAPLHTSPDGSLRERVPSTMLRLQHFVPVCKIGRYRDETFERIESRCACAVLLSEFLCSARWFTRHSTDAFEDGGPSEISFPASGSCGADELNAVAG